MGTGFQTGDLGAANQSASPPHHHTRSKQQASGSSFPLMISIKMMEKLWRWMVVMVA